jgi:hypothetical protein
MIFLEEADERLPMKIIFSFRMPISALKDFFPLPS